MRDRVAIRHDVAGDLRFISHHDTLRLWERALARAAIPVKFSEGFNPRPRMSLSLPRSVGIASSDELLVIELSEPIDFEEMRARLGEQMPDGMSITRIERVDADDRRLPNAAEYEVTIDAGADVALATRAAAILSETSVFVDRATPGMAVRHIDVRPYIASITVEPERLRWTQGITATGSVRPQEVLELLGLAVDDHLHRLRRVGVTYGR